MELVLVLGSYLLILILVIAFIKIILGGLEFIWNNVFTIIAIILLISLLMGI
jgi:hypothetical protein